MIIDENGFNNKMRTNNNFQNPMRQSFNKKRNIFTKNIKDMGPTSATNEKGVTDLSLALLQELLDKNLITQEEFIRKCKHIAEKRNH